MGWRTDPWQRHQVRFFDGVRWTEHVADAGLAGIDTTPVADLERSRPPADVGAIPDGGPGPHVIDGASPRGTVDDDLLLLAGPDDRGRRTLLTADDVPVGHLVVPRRRWPARLLGLLAVPATAPPTALEVRDDVDRVVVRIARPRRRIEPVVDISVPGGPRGKVTASAVRRGIDAEVTADGTVVGRLTAPAGPVRHEVRSPEGTVLARTSDVWDVPGQRRHIPPGTSLVDRCHLTGGTKPDDDHGRARLLLGALLAPELLLPPAP